MAMKLTDVQPGFYVAHKKTSKTEFIAVVWGVYPFLQVYEVPSDLGSRPHFSDVEIQDCEFLARIPDVKTLAGTVANG